MRTLLSCYEKGKNMFTPTILNKEQISKTTTCLWIIKANKQKILNLSNNLFIAAIPFNVGVMP